MDPNATLARLLGLATMNEHAQATLEKAAIADEMSELIEALDGWISKGGFLPDRWRKAA